MNIEYVDYDPCDKAGVYDNRADEKEAEVISKNEAELLRRAQLAKQTIERLKPPRRVKCPEILTSLTI
ncbi:hypothetical protein GQ600_8953 [Phytophthora cactorum]|nr:hypothetical protein GQ600_8953 [Phytophthora cactorum]